MNKVLSFIILFLGCFYGYAQTLNWMWGRQAISTRVSEGWSIAADKSENVFIGGFYMGFVTFGSYTVSNPINDNAFVAKYDANGTVKWAHSSSGTGTYGYGVTTDGWGNSYLTGYFYVSTGFGSNTISSAGGTDVFLVKYDSSGNVRWAKNAGGTAAEVGRSVVTDASGNIYVTGDFTSPTFTIGSFTLNTTGGVQNSFLAKYDSSGNVLWAKSSAGAASTVTSYGVTTDSQGNVFITGSFVNPTTFGSYTLTGSGGNDIFLVKYDSSGNVLWAKSAGSTGGENGYSVATDASNNVCMTGIFGSTSITFGSTTLTKTGNTNGFLVKYDSSGNVIWARSMNGPGNVIGYGAGTDKNNKIYLTGSFNSTFVTMDTITLIAPSGVVDPMFVAGYDSSGHIFFAKALASGGDDNNAVAVTPSGCVYIGGDMQDTMIVGNDTLHTQILSETAFVAKLCFTGLQANFVSSDTVFCGESGSCIDFTDHSTNNPSSWKWYFPGATPDTSTQQNPANICYYTPGTYAVSLVVSNASGSDSITVSPMITFASAAAPPVLTFSGDTIYCSHAAAYQWYFNGSPIGGATDSFYVALVDGVYAVQITDDNGCTRLSNGFPILVNEVNEESKIEIFPNPAKEELYVMSYGLRVNAGARLEINNVLGENVYRLQLSTQNPQPKTKIDISSFAKGVYFIEVGNGDRIYRAKFVKE